MNFSHSTPLLFGAVAALWASALSAQAPDTILLRDLAVAGLTNPSDTAAARRALGRPTSVVQDTQPNDDGVLLTHWQYPDLSVTFDASGALHRVTITSPAVATSRGVRVGETGDSVRRVYGRPTYSDDGHLLYARSTSEFETLGITFFLTDGVITMIIIGTVISVE